VRRWSRVLLLWAISGCSTSPPVAPTPALPIAVASAPPLPAPVVDTCGAADLQGLIGKPRMQAPVPIRPERQRVTCTTCPIPQDVDETRLNIFFAADTGRITLVRCG